MPQRISNFKNTQIQYRFDVCIQHNAYSMPLEYTTDNPRNCLWLFFLNNSSLFLLKTVSNIQCTPTKVRCFNYLFLCHSVFLTNCVIIALTILFPTCSIKFFVSIPTWNSFDVFVVLCSCLVHDFYSPFVINFQLKVLKLFHTGQKLHEGIKLNKEKKNYKTKRNFTFYRKRNNIWILMRLDW